MRLYEVTLSAHILSAVVLVGGSILAAPAIDNWIRRADDITTIRRWLTVGKPLATIKPVAAIVLLISGLYVTSVGHWWQYAWLQVSLGLWVVNCVLAVTVIKPTMDRVAELAFDQSLIGPELDGWRKAKRWELASDVTLANDLGVLFLMTNRGDYVQSLVVIAVANAAVLLYRAARSAAARKPVSELGMPRDEVVAGSPTA